MIPRLPHKILELLYFLYSRFFEEWNWKKGDIDGVVGKRTGGVSVGAIWRCFLLDSGAEACIQKIFIGYFVGGLCSVLP